jgi:nitroreductase
METVKANQVLANINERRAVREYTSKPVDRQIIETLLEAGRMAPSAINKQPWKFHIVTDIETIKRFSKEITKVAEGHFHLSHGVDFLKTEDAIFHGAPVVVFISAPKDNDWAPIDIGMCAENIMLAAKSLGLDSCPVGMAKFVEQTSCYSELKIPSTEHILLSIVLGYGKEKPAIHTRLKNNAFYI